MTLLQKFLKDTTPELIERNVRLQAIGRLDELPAGCQRQLQTSIETTAAQHRPDAGPGAQLQRRASR